MTGLVKWDEHGMYTVCFAYVEFGNYSTRFALVYFSSLVIECEDWEEEDDGNGLVVLYSAT